eukprot:448998_1
MVTFNAVFAIVWQVIVYKLCALTNDLTESRLVKIELEDLGHDVYDELADEYDQYLLYYNGLDDEALVVPPKKTVYNTVKDRGLRPNDKRRSKIDVKKLIKKIPFKLRKNPHKFLSQVHAGHIKPHSQGGSNSAFNIEWQNKRSNLKLGAYKMSQKLKKLNTRQNNYFAKKGKFSPQIGKQEAGEIAKIRGKPAHLEYEVQYGQSTFPISGYPTYDASLAITVFFLLILVSFVCSLCGAFAGYYIAKKFGQKRNYRYQTDPV